VVKNIIYLSALSAAGGENRRNNLTTEAQSSQRCFIFFIFGERPKMKKVSTLRVVNNMDVNGISGQVIGATTAVHNIWI
jgi:hypothetical protein